MREAIKEHYARCYIFEDCSTLPPNLAIRDMLMNGRHVPIRLIAQKQPLLNEYKAPNGEYNKDLETKP